MTVTTYTANGSVEQTFYNVSMAVLNDDGLCQLMRVDSGGVSHLDTIKAEHNVSVLRSTT